MLFKRILDMITEKIWKNFGGAMVALMVIGGGAGNMAVVNASDSDYEDDEAEDLSKYTPEQRKLVEICGKNKRGDNIVEFFGFMTHLYGDFIGTIAASRAGAVNFFNSQKIVYALNTVEFKDYPQLIEVPTIPEGASAAKKRELRDSIKQVKNKNHSLQAMIDREKNTREIFQRTVKNIIPFFGNAIVSLRNIDEKKRNDLLQKLLTGNGISSINRDDFLKLPVADLNRLKASLADNWCELARLVITENPKLSSNNCH